MLELFKNADQILSFFMNSIKSAYLVNYRNPKTIVAAHCYTTLTL